MKTIKLYEAAFVDAIQRLLESVYTKIPKEIEIENHQKYVDDEYSNHRWEYQMEKDSFVREIVTEMMGLNENEEGFAEREETILMLKEIALHKPVLRFKSYFENAIKDGSIGYYTKKIIQHFKEKVELEGVSTEDFPTLIDFISKCIIKTVFLTKTDGKLSLYFGIRTEIHYELLKNVVDTYIEYSMIRKGYEIANFFSEILNDNAHAFNNFEYQLKEIVREAEFENDYRPLVLETVSYHLQNKIEYLKKKYLLTYLQNIEPPKAGAGDGKKRKQPTAKTVMEFVRQIDAQAKIIPKPNEYQNNDEKFTIIAKRIKDKFEYQFSGKTLEKEDCKQDGEGYKVSVYNLLKEWEYNPIATKYNAKHNR